MPIDACLLCLDGKGSRTNLNKTNHKEKREGRKKRDLAEDGTVRYATTHGDHDQRQ